MILTTLKLFRGNVNSRLSHIRGSKHVMELEKARKELTEHRVWNQDQTQKTPS